LDASRLPLSDPAGQANNIRIRLEADETISSGGCIIETESGDVDARIETQLDIIKAAFREKLG
jgi:flagellar biosynthesis/type III secretory pathway protein FliH